MTLNGYRLFVVSLHDGRVRTEQPFEAAQARKPEDGPKPSVVDYRDTAVAYVTSHTDETSNIGVPDKVAAGDDAEEAGQSKGSSTRLLTSERVGDAVRFWYSSGPINWDGISADPTGATEDVQLKGRSTLHDYRATLVTQPGATRAILVVEVRGRSCPYGPLIRALARWSPVPWRIKVHENVADSAAVDDFIARGEIQHVDLTEWIFDNDGGKTAKNHVLSARVEGQTRIDAAKRYLRSWALKGKESSPVEVGKQAKKAKGSFFSMKVEIPFNDVAITVKSGTQQRTLKPSSDYKRFTYHLAESIVDDVMFFDAAERTASELIKNVQIVAEDE